MNKLNKKNFLSGLEFILYIYFLLMPLMYFLQFQGLIYNLYNYFMKTFF